LCKKESHGHQGSDLTMPGRKFFNHKQGCECENGEEKEDHKYRGMKGKKEKGRVKRGKGKTE